MKSSGQEVEQPGAGVKRNAVDKKWNRQEGSGQEVDAERCKSGQEESEQEMEWQGQEWTE